MHFSTLLCIGFLSTLSSAVPYTYQKRQLNSTVTNGTTTEYDYIIVGGGTAGLVLANRLSQNSSVQVAVIEAGGRYETLNPVYSTTPGLDGIGVGSSPSSTDTVDWNFITTPQEAIGNRSIHYARGKCLGGTSARNFLIYQRGSKQSYDQWASAVGDSSYTFQNLLPYFKKSVQFTPPNTTTRFSNATARYNAAAFSSTGEPLQVSYPNYAHPWSTWVQPALNAIGIPTTQDFNSGSLMGAQYSSQTLRPTDEVRDTSESSFLAAASSRPNLVVLSNTMAQKILFNGTTATGVQVLPDGALASVQYTARKEIILSAGAFQSPQLLMVSGVGPAATLKKYKIPVIANRAGVGQNMRDHVFFGPSYRVNVPTLTRQANDPAYNAEEFANYIRGEGPFTNNAADFLGWEKIPDYLREDFSSRAQSELSKFPDDWPEVEFFSTPAFAGNFSDLSQNQPKDGYQYATILAALVAPLSRGSVTISSADVTTPPVIDPKWLSSTTDQQVAIAGYKRARAAFQSAPMKRVLIGPEYYPGASVNTDAEILASIKSNLMTVWHAACTCAMGRTSDPNAVVDSSAKVIGVKNLRVVDASSFPILPPGHPQSTIYALAEKISDLIIKGK